MSNWLLPPQRAKDVYDSLTAQASRHIEAPPPNQQEQERVLDHIEKIYPHTASSPALSGDKVNWPLLKEELNHILDNDVNETASPGLPFKTSFGTIKQVRESERNTLISLVFRRIEALQGNLSEMTPVELVKEGICDPVYLFIKGEPHPQRKIKSKTWRLISSVSLVDQLIDRLLHSTQNNVEIGLWKYLSSKPGIGFTEDACNALRKDLERRTLGAPFAQADVQGWDWSVQGWEQNMEAEARVRLTRTQGTVAATLMRARATCLNRPVYATASGDLYTQSFEGVMKSGTYCTSSSNSRIRVMAALLVGAGWCIAMGDDSIEQPVPGAKEKYLKLGHKLREYSLVSGDFDFCSQTFHTNGTTKPVDPTKSLYALCCNPITVERLEAYLDHVKDHPDISAHVAALRGDLDLSISPEAFELLQTWQ